MRRMMLRIWLIWFLKTLDTRKEKANKRSQREGRSNCWRLCLELLRGTLKLSRILTPGMSKEMGWNCHRSKKRRLTPKGWSWVKTGRWKGWSSMTILTRIKDPLTRSLTSGSPMSSYTNWGTPKLHQICIVNLKQAKTKAFGAFFTTIFQATKTMSGSTTSWIVLETRRTQSSLSKSCKK